MELEAFERKQRLVLTVWEADALMRIDDVVLSAASGSRDSRAEVGDQAGYAITDVDNIRAMVKATAARRRLIAEANAQAAAIRRQSSNKPQT